MCGVGESRNLAGNNRKDCYSVTYKLEMGYASRAKFCISTDSQDQNLITYSATRNIPYCDHRTLAVIPPEYQLTYKDSQLSCVKHQI